MGNSTISMAIFNSYVKLPEGIQHDRGEGTLLGIARKMGRRNWMLRKEKCQSARESVRSNRKRQEIWVCLKMSCTPLYPMVLLIIIPTSNGYFIGGMPHFQTYPFANFCHLHMCLKRKKTNLLLAGVICYKENSH